MSDLDYSKPPEQAAAELETIKSQLNKTQLERNMQEANKNYFKSQLDENEKEIGLLRKALELVIDYSNNNDYCLVPAWEEKCSDYDDCNKCVMEFYMTKAKKLLEEWR